MNNWLVRFAIAGLLVFLPLAGLNSTADAQTFSSERYAFRLTPIAKGLDYPWSMAILPNGDVLITERSGKLRIVRGGRLDRRSVPGVPDSVQENQGGLLDIALHPDFAKNRLVYLSYTGGADEELGTEVGRGRFDGERLVGFRKILDAGPKSDGGRHFGSRLVFDRQGYLFVTSGDRASPSRAQRLDDLAGKIIRIGDDGRIPPDNPFVGRAGARPEIYSYGNRNPQGLALHPVTGRIWAAEHGPRGGDEINLIARGVNYGWPVITYGRSYAGFKIGEGTHKSGMAQPVRYWVPSISPSGMVFYTGNDFPAWRGNLFLGALSGQVLVRLEMDGNRVVREERLLRRLDERIRDVRQGPDGKLYILTDSSEGAMLRLDPAGR